MEQTLERQGFQFYKQAQSKTHTLKISEANSSEIIYFSFQLGVVCLDMRILRGNRKPRRVALSGSAVLTGAALGVVLWLLCWAPAPRDPLQSCRALTRRDSEGLPVTHAIKQTFIPFRFLLRNLAWSVV